MDKKNTIIGIILVGAAFLLMMKQSQNEPAPAPVVQSQQVSTTSNAQTATNSASSLLASSAPAEAVQAISHDQAEEIVELQNEFIIVKFTSWGGAIKEVALRKHPEELDSEIPFAFNQNAAIPALSISINGSEQFAPSYRVVSKTATTITFEHEMPNGVSVFREYSLASNSDERDPYLVNHTTRFHNKSLQPVYLNNIFVHLGAIPPAGTDSRGEFLNFGYYNGEKEEFIGVSDFKANSGILGMGRREGHTEIQKSYDNLIWAAVKNQFFTSILTPSTPAKGFRTSPVQLAINGTDGETEEGISGSLEFGLGELASNNEKTLDFTYYIGPKEYSRLEKLGDNQDLLMQFGIFGFISKLLITMLASLYQLIPNYGVVIIIVTILIKLLLWPLTAISTRSSKRMSQLQAPLKELRERLKDNPQKMQQETMKLFKAHKVNPAAGCLPIFIQIPIFLGLFSMLRGAAELRFASFLWIPDLSVPDTVMEIAGMPINILPLIMGATMFAQMQLTPSMSTDQLQAKIFKFMPFIFLFICYSFPAGLVLYWTVQNLLTILQQYITNKSTEPVEVILPTTKKKKNKR